MKLYYMPGACSLATHTVLEWIGQPYETQKLSHDDLKKDAYLRVNPAGAVPTLEHEGWVLTQNTAILGYLADAYPKAKLGGDGTPKARAEVNRWLGFVNSDMHPIFKPLFGSTGYLEDEATIGKTKAHSQTMLRELFERVNAQLKGRNWITGTRSIADPYLFAVARWAQALKLDLSGLDDLERFFRHMNDDPGVKKALKDEGLV